MDLIIFFEELEETGREVNRIYYINFLNYPNIKNKKIRKIVGH